MTLPTRRTLMLGSLGLLLLMALILALRDPPVLVDSAPVTRERFRVVVEEEGRSRVRDHYQVTAPVSGYLDRVTVEPGDIVDEHAPLFRIHPPPADPLDTRTRSQMEAALERGEMALEAARMDQQASEAQAEFAESELARLERLFQQQHVSREAVDRARAEARSSRAAARSASFRVDVARHEQELIRVSLISSGPTGEGAPVVVEAPVPGVVLKRERESAGLVQAGAPVLQLADLDSLEVEVDVLSPDAVRLQPGMPVELERWGGDSVLRGTVRRIDPAGFTRVSALGVEEQRVWVIVGLAEPRKHWAGLGHGYRVEARFILRDQEDVLQVPGSALFREDGRWATYVIDGGRARHRVVDVGARSGLAAELLGGLEVGERVVLHPGDAIAEGTRVEVR